MVRNGSPRRHASRTLVTGQTGSSQGMKAEISEASLSWSTWWEDCGSPSVETVENMQLNGEIQMCQETASH